MDDVALVRAGRRADGIVTATFYEIVRDFYGRNLSGKEARLLRKAIETLAGALVSIGGFNAHTGERMAKLVSLARLVESAVWAEDVGVAAASTRLGSAVGARRMRLLRLWRSGGLHLGSLLVLSGRVDGLANARFLGRSGSGIDQPRGRASPARPANGGAGRMAAACRRLSEAARAAVAEATSTGLQSSGPHREREREREERHV